MKEDAIIWIILLTVFVTLGTAGLGFYMYMDEAIRDFFFA